MRNQRVLEMTTIAMFAAIIMIQTFVPFLGFITFGVISFTVIHITVLIGAIFGGRNVSIALGFTFGLGSLLRALIAPETPLDIFFVNPLVSVLPRVLFGVVIWYLYGFFKKIFKFNLISIALTFAFSTLIHTVLTLTAFYLFAYNSDIYNQVFGEMNVIGLILLVLGSNGLLEIGIALFVASPIAWSIQKMNDTQLI